MEYKNLILLFSAFAVITVIAQVTEKNESDEGSQEEENESNEDSQEEENESNEDSQEEENENGSDEEPDEISKIAESITKKLIDCAVQSFDMFRDPMEQQLKIIEKNDSELMYYINCFIEGMQNFVFDMVKNMVLMLCIMMKAMGNNNMEILSAERALYNN
ncbi:hypothetical protein PUN28_004125 [Cardiocondyla obscurior]|uniref:Uncharacterized protein n=1 Tax=Cardiocondyla obscurior TaxID=286306 RepID=A0AAW2GPN9_9HYME